MARLRFISHKPQYRTSLLFSLSLSSDLFLCHYFLYLFLSAKFSIHSTVRKPNLHFSIIIIFIITFTLSLSLYLYLSHSISLSFFSNVFICHRMSTLSLSLNPTTAFRPSMHDTTRCRLTRKRRSSSHRRNGSTQTRRILNRRFHEFFRLQFSFTCKT